MASYPEPETPPPSAERRQQLERARGQIEEELRKFEAMGDDEMNANQAQIKASVSRIKATLKEVGLASVERHTNDRVGVHPNNRWGHGLDVQQVHELMKQIVPAGWDMEEVRQAMCFARAPGRFGNAHFAFNWDIATASDGYLAVCSETKMQYFSVGNSHTVAVLRCLLEGTLGYLEDIVGPDNKLSKDLLYTFAPTFRDAVENGFEWFTIAWEVDVEWPSLSLLLQAGLNESHGAIRQQSKLMTLRQIHVVARCRENANSKHWESRCSHVAWSARVFG
jgi:hypothetical protein